MIDCHVHSNNSDGEDSLEEIVQDALSKNLAVVGLSNHALSANEQTNYMTRKRTIEYLDKISHLKQRFGNRLKILGGLEVDYSIADESFLRSQLSGLNPDFVLASIHSVNTNGQEISLWDYESMNSPEAIKSYFDNLHSAVESGLFDGIAHPELISHAVPLLEDTFYTLIDLCRDKGVAFEVNAAGLTRNVYDPLKKCMLPESRYPDRKVMNRLVSRRVPIIIGSDAHKIQYLGGNISQTLALLKEAGARNVNYIESRNKVKFQI